MSMDDYKKRRVEVGKTDEEQRDDLIDRARARVQADRDAKSRADQEREERERAKRDRIRREMESQQDGLQAADGGADAGEPKKMKKKKY